MEAVHPSDHEIQEYCEFRAPEQVVDAIESHIVYCPECSFRIADYVKTNVPEWRITPHTAVHLV